MQVSLFPDICEWGLMWNQASVFHVFVFIDLSRQISVCFLWITRSKYYMSLSILPIQEEDYDVI